MPKDFINLYKIKCLDKKYFCPFTKEDWKLFCALLKTVSAHMCDGKVVFLKANINDNVYLWIIL